jgi:hypothetical protein
MAITYGIYALSFFLVMFLGFASHRASLCTVRAVDEILGTRRAHVLWSFAKTALWAMVASLTIMWLAPGQALKFQTTAPILIALTGGFLFGVGAAINGGCSFSTLQRLADGEVWMLATLAGFTAGAAGWFALEHILAIATSPLTIVVRIEQVRWVPVALGVLWLWAAWELMLLWRVRPKGIEFRHIIGADTYHLSAAALVIGLSGGVLYTLHDSWTYTNTMRRGAAFLLGDDSAPPAVQVVLFLALFLGMVLSSWQRGSVRLSTQPLRNGLRHLTGGLMMGLGGAVIPGGNDTLILKGIPTFSPEALMVYLSLIAGVASVLLLMRAVRVR